MTNWASRPPPRGFWAGRCDQLEWADRWMQQCLAGHAFIQNVRRGHYELGVDEPVTLRVMAAFDEFALAI